MTVDCRLWHKEHGDDDHLGSWTTSRSSRCAAGHGCPLAPPAAFAEWREADGLQLALWRGSLTWVISRYEDIRAALVDPRLSAETIPDDLKADGHR